MGKHTAFDALRPAAAKLAAAHPAVAPDFLLHQTSWDPFAFIDFCEESLDGRTGTELLCRHIQQREWEMLFDYCYRQAIGQ